MVAAGVDVLIRGAGPVGCALGAVEDDVLVTDAGCEVITAEAPKTVADVEALMRDARGRD